LKGQVETLANPMSLVNEFFPHLPGEAVSVGFTWTDTLSWEVDTGTGVVTSSKVTTYTVQGDSVLDGSALVHITFEGEGERVANVVQDGMEAVQSVSGDTKGTVLWDPTRSLMVRFEEAIEMSGMYEMVGAPIPPMPLSVRGKTVRKLQGA
jgi:hypothetical protein